jgi:hypothetical protein
MRQLTAHTFPCPAGKGAKRKVPDATSQQSAHLQKLDTLRARCLQLLPMCKGEFSVDAPAATRAVMAQQARKLLSEMAHNLDTLRGLGSPGNPPTSISELALEARRPTKVAAPESI